MSRPDLAADAHVLLLCEGTGEQVIAEKLAESNGFFFDAERIVDISRARAASKVQAQYLNLDYDWPVSIIRILDSRKESFRLGNLYRDRFPVINVHTHPEVEVLILLREGHFDRYSRRFKKNMRPSEYCANQLKLGAVKSRGFLEEYWDAASIKDAAAQYASKVKIPKGEYALADLL